MIELNFFAILVAAIVGVVLGALWYSPLLFGKQWMALSGMTPEKMEAAKQKGMTKAYIFHFIGVLVMVYVVAHLTFGLRLAGLADGLQLGLWLWLGFFVPTQLGAVLWENKSWKLYFINVAYYLVALLIIGGIIGGWM